MDKRNKQRKFGRETKPRAALMKALATALISHGRMTTTEAKAKSLRPYVEKLVTRGKKNDMASVRELRKTLNAGAVTKLIKELGPRFMTRPGGYTRIIKLPQRISDGARMAVIEFVS